MMKFTLSNFSKIGFISKLNGYNGELVLATDQDHLPDDNFLFIKLDESFVPFAVEDLFEKHANVILKLHDVNDADYAARFVNHDVYRMKDNKRRIIKDEFSGESLEGFHLIDTVHGDLGPILRTETYPMQEIATCHFNGKEILIPLNRDFVERVDKTKKEIHVNLPNGLIEIYLNP